MTYLAIDSDLEEFVILKRFVRKNEALVELVARSLAESRQMIFGKLYQSSVIWMENGDILCMNVDWIFCFRHLALTTVNIQLLALTTVNIQPSLTLHSTDGAQSSPRLKNVCFTNDGPNNNGKNNSARMRRIVYPKNKVVRETLWTRPPSVNTWPLGFSLQWREWKTTIYIHSLNVELPCYITWCAHLPVVPS